jgi:transposase
MHVASIVPRLPIVLRPASGEHIHGFLGRLAEANGHLGMVAFTRAIGLGTGFGPTSAGVAWRRLAEVACLTEDEIAAMRWRSPEGRKNSSMVTVAGVRTAIGLAYPATTRLCISCLRETGVRPNFWCFTIVAACPRHEVLLTTECTCGRKLPHGSAGRTRECACGADWYQFEERLAPASAVRIARNLAYRLGPDSRYPATNDFGPPFDQLCAHDYMATVHTLGVAATTPAAEDVLVQKGTGTYRRGASRILTGTDLTISRLDAAVRVMDGWPDSYFALLKEVEGRNTSADSTTIAGAFATSIGKLLICPARGADGLPLPFLWQMADRYWADCEKGTRRRRRRNPTTRDATARRLHTSFNISGLARVLGLPHGTAFLGRILARILGSLSDEDRALGDDDLARVVRDRAVTLYHAAAASLSSEAASNIVEGVFLDRALKGWEHPRLLPADPSLFNLRLRGKRAYAAADVDATLARLRSVSRQVETSKGLSPLVVGGFRQNARPWYNKTDMLVDVMEGRLAVYSTSNAPTLSDLLIDLEDVRRARCARSPVNQPPEGLATQKQVNVVLQGRFGAKERLTRNEFRRLARGGLIRHEVVQKSVRNRTAPHKVRLYCVDDVVEFVRRRRTPIGLPADVLAAFGRLQDITPLLAALNATGMTASRMGVELAARGIRTPDGATWGHKLIAQALGHAQAGRKVTGLLTGRSFVEGLLMSDALHEKPESSPPRLRAARSSDVNDEEWAFLAPHLALQSEGAWHRKYPLREIFNGLRYMATHKSGWSSLPDDLPPWYAILAQSRRWIAKGRLELAITALRAERLEPPVAINVEQNNDVLKPASDVVAGGPQLCEQVSATSLAEILRAVREINRLIRISVTTG